MKKIYLILLAWLAFSGINATTFTVTIGPGSVYTPSVTTCAVGDQVIIQASTIHPTAQVSQATWLANGTATLAGGWGSNTTTFTFTAVSTGTVYYVCTNHVALSGMKGMVVVNPTGINENASDFLKSYNLFPNPASSNVKVSFGLNESSTVNIKLFNIAGQEVKTFVSELNLVTGNYEYSFELPQSIASGNYFIEVSSGNRKSTKKLLVTK